MTIPTRNGMPIIYGPHDEKLVSALVHWTERTLNGQAPLSFSIFLPCRLADDTIRWQDIWIGPSALKLKDSLFTHNDDGVSWRMTCRRCNGVGKCSFVGAKGNLYTSAHEKDCFLCGRRGFHILPDVERVIAAHMVMAMYTVNSRTRNIPPKAELLYRFLLCQLEYAYEAYPDEEYEVTWETILLDALQEIFQAVYNQQTSERLAQVYPNSWALAERGYQRMIQTYTAVEELEGLFFELFGSVE